MARVERFGTTADGREVRKITLQRGDLTVALLTLGAVLQSVRLRPDKVLTTLPLVASRTTTSFAPCAVAI